MTGFASDPNLTAIAATGDGQTPRMIAGVGRQVSAIQRGRKQRLGEIFVYPTVALPARCYQCNGQAISREQNPALFALIGVKYGAGDGLTTFNLPEIPNVVGQTHYLIQA